uniref:Chemokine interleukin-8-like domain-containing protein n=1 Tax=Cyprinus carpio TaxID=7962 RepID=A0A8C1P6E8_CYPCA
MKFTLFVAILFSIGWMSAVVKGDGHPVDCCNTVTNSRISVEDILYYDMQNTNLCPGRAVRFYTKKNITICSDPDSIWAKKAKAIVDGRTTIKTSGPETEKNKTSIQPTSVSKDNPESSQTHTETSKMYEGPSPNCCLRVSKTKISVEAIMNYSMQAAPPCPIRAVRFHTKKNKTICSDPNEGWAKKAITHVNQKLNPLKLSKEPTMCYTITTNLIPTTTSTIKTPGTETETSTSTPVPTTMKTKKTRLEKVISKTTIQPASGTEENQESTAIRCGTSEKTAPPAETTRTRVTKTTKKLYHSYAENS